jgi:hypothetical protein
VSQPTDNHLNKKKKKTARLQFFTIAGIHATNSSFLDDDDDYYDIFNLSRITTVNV